MRGVGHPRPYRKTGKCYIVVKHALTYLNTLRAERRTLGWRGLLRRRGWRLVVLVVAAYLVRDLVLYVFIPVLVVLGLSR